LRELFTGICGRDAESDVLRGAAAAANPQVRRSSLMPAGWSADRPTSQAQPTSGTPQADEAQPSGVVVRPWRRRAWRPTSRCRVRLPARATADADSPARPLQLAFDSIAASTTTVAVEPADQRLQTGFWNRTGLLGENSGLRRHLFRPSSQQDTESPAAQCSAASRAPSHDGDKRR
jgi:hypothetical protein